jgi:release factor glutamine methyltransferase
LDEDIRFFEPKIALSGGIDGYSRIKNIINRSAVLIKKKGKLFLEIGNDQMNQTTKLLKNRGFFISKIVKDLARNNRCIISTKI